MDEAKNFDQAVESFRGWAGHVADTSKEWEVDYPDWSWIYTCVKNMLMIPFSKWDDATYSNLLYMLARDNENENILDILVSKHPDLVIYLAKCYFDWPDYEARWQIAYALGRIAIDKQILKELLDNFLRDEHAYVRQRAFNVYRDKFERDDTQ